MRRYRLTIAPIVDEQIADQVLFIAQDSIDNALAWESRIRKAIETLSTFCGYADDEDATARLGYRLQKLVFEGTYLIHFHVDESAGEVFVINFRHGSRRPGEFEP